MSEPVPCRSDVGWGSVLLCGFSEAFGEKIIARRAWQSSLYADALRSRVCILSSTESVVYTTGGSEDTRVPIPESPGKPLLLP